MTRLELWCRATVERTSLIRLLPGIFLLIVPILAFSQTASRSIEYLSPQPGSSLVSQQSNIIIRAKNAFDPSVPIDASDVVVVGSQTGEHAGSLTLSDNGRTLVFKPSSVFAPSENVTVRLRPAVFRSEDANAVPLEFGFTISPLSSLDQEMFLDHWASSESLHPSRINGRPSGQLAPTVKSVADTNDSLPLDFPQRTIMTSGATAPGSLFLASFKISQAGDHYTFVSLVPSDQQYLMILDNSGTPGFYRAMGSISTDFKLQPNGRLTYNDGTVDIFYELDSNYVVMDAFQAGNGYRTNVHDLHVSPNGRALILADDPEIVDMSKIVTGREPQCDSYRGRHPGA